MSLLVTTRTYFNNEFTTSHSVNELSIADIKLGHIAFTIERNFIAVHELHDLRLTRESLPILEVMKAMIVANAGKMTDRNIAKLAKELAPVARLLTFEA